MNASIHLRVDAEPAASPALFSQRVTGDFLITLKVDDAEFGVLRAGSTLAWLTRKAGATWRVDATSEREKLADTVSVAAVSFGARLGYLTCRRLTRTQAMAVLEAATAPVELLAA